ncbi:hypothetical protein EQV77_11020 [Halobacillus fulvus]|nr:hypothetical protein EQV77_11020 [Halobacillus fulvus]
MKKFIAIMMGVMVLFLAACGSNTETSEANSDENEDQETTSQEQEPEVDMDALIEQLSMDATVETTEDDATFKFSLENTGDEPVILGFTSSQKYEIQVANAEGESVYTFSADKMFTQELTTEELASGDVFSAQEMWTGIEQPGEYEATMTFLVNTINDQPVEATPFQVTQPFTIEEAQAEEAPEDSSEVRQYEGDGEAFRNLEVTGENGSYVVTGEARVNEGTFMYSVEDGHNVLVEPTVFQVEAGAPEWASFELEINIAEEDLPEFRTLTLMMFQKSSEDGQPADMNAIPLEQL